MKKTISISLLLLLINTAFAQIRTTIYQNRTVKIFPYRIQVEGENNYSWDMMFENMSIPYCPEKLEDGEYIIYYKPEIDWNDYEKSMKQIARGDTFFIAINFFIKGGIKEGPVLFYEYYHQKKPVATGYYANNVKSGTWKLVSKDGKVTAGYKDGKMEGLAVIEDNKRKMRTMVNFKQGQMDGRMEIYKGKKLMAFHTYKAGKKYGPFYDSDNNEIVTGYKLSGFSLSGDFDSITQLYDKKNKLVQSHVNSGNPLAGNDTTEMNWYVYTSNFTLWMNTFLNFHSYYLPFETLYTNYYEIDAKGRKINNFYLIDRKIKIPFAYVNLLGDTILKVDRVAKNNKYITYQKTETEYDKNRQIKSMEVSQSKVLSNGEFVNLLKDSLLYKVTYDSKTIDKFYLQNRPVNGYKGFIIKKDSTSSIDRLTLKPTNSILEHYAIPVLNKEFTQWTSSWGNGDPDVFGYPDIEFKLTGNDTIEIMEKNSLNESLTTVKSFKIWMEDSFISVSGSEGDKLIDPYDICWDWGWGTTSFIGQSNSVIYYKDKPYSGLLFINTKLSKRLGQYETEIKLKETKEGLSITRYSHKERSYRKIARNLKRIKTGFNEYYDPAVRPANTQVRYLFNYSKGKLNGYQWAGTGEQTIYQLNFKNGISHGFQNYCIGKSVIEPLMYNEYLSRINYDSARIDGYVILNNNENEPLLVAKYNKGKLNGNYVEFSKNAGFYSEPKPLIEANFINDTLDGWVVVYHHGDEKERIPFIKGEATGYYSKNMIQPIEAEQSDSVHNYQPYTKRYKELKIKLNNGIIRDTIYGYFDHGGVKYTAVVDTGFRHRYVYQVASDLLVKDKAGAFDTSLKDYVFSVPQIIDGSQVWNNEGAPDVAVAVAEEITGAEGIVFGISGENSETGIDLDPLFDYVKATFAFYYKNGVKSQEGKMANNMKYGTWKYFAENGTLMKEIEYKWGIDSSSAKQTVYYRGKIKGYYASGKKLMEGLITDEELSYQCNQEVEVAYENVYYLNFFDEQGNQTLNNLTGSVSDYHLNGNKRFTGQITNGQRTGLWKFYDPTGNLSAIGEYADGKKQGKWLEGDLGGVNYIDNACTVNEALSMMKERQARDIDITETLYEMGVEISKSYLVLEKF